MLAAWKERQRLALTPQRAAKLVAKLLPHPTSSTSTQDLTLESSDDLLDLLAIVAYDHAPALAGKRIRWRVDGPRRRHGLEPQVIEQDSLVGHRVERFAITREG